MALGTDLGVNMNETKNTTVSKDVIVTNKDKIVSKEDNDDYYLKKPVTSSMECR